MPDKGGLPKKSDKRPGWAICGKVIAKMETLLFKEKFFDWPEASRLIQVTIIILYVLVDFHVVVLFALRYCNL